MEWNTEPCLDWFLVVVPDFFVHALDDWVVWLLCGHKTTTTTKTLFILHSLHKTPNPTRGLNPALTEHPQLRLALVVAVCQALDEADEVHLVPEPGLQDSQEDLAGPLGRRDVHLDAAGELTVGFLDAHRGVLEVDPVLLAGWIQLLSCTEESNEGMEEQRAMVNRGVSKGVQSDMDPGLGGPREQALSLSYGTKVWRT